VGDALGELQRCKHNHPVVEAEILDSQLLGLLALQAGRGKAQIANRRTDRQVELDRRRRARAENDGVVDVPVLLDRDLDRQLGFATRLNAVMVRIQFGRELQRLWLGHGDRGRT
jgi:hypothetical protein